MSLDASFFFAPRHRPQRTLGVNWANKSPSDQVQWTHLQPVYPGSEHGDLDTLLRDQDKLMPWAQLSTRKQHSWRVQDTAKTKRRTMNRMSITTVSTNNNSLLRCIHVASLGSHEASGVNSQNTKISFFTYIISITWWQQMTFKWPIDPCHCATAILKLLENTFERHLKCSIQIVLIHIHTYSDKCPHIRTCPHTHTRKDPFMYNYRSKLFRTESDFSVS